MKSPHWIIWKVFGPILFIYNRYIDLVCLSLSGYRGFGKVKYKIIKKSQNDMVLSVVVYGEMEGIFSGIINDCG